MQAGAIALLMITIVSLQILCVFDRVCGSSTFDPAIPNHTASTIVALAVMSIVVVVPISLYSIKPEASNKIALLTIIITVS